MAIDVLGTQQQRRRRGALDELRRPMVDSVAEQRASDPAYRFSTPSERESGRDFLTGKPIGPAESTNAVRDTSSPRKSPLAATLSAPAAKPKAGLYPASAPQHAPGDVVAADGSITTSRQTPEQSANQQEFDRKMGFTSAPTDTQQILSNRSDRLAKDGYDLDYSENTSGTFGSSGSQLAASRTGLPEVRKAIPVTPSATPAIPAKPAAASANPALDSLRYPLTLAPTSTPSTTVYSGPGSTAVAPPPGPTPTAPNSNALPSPTPTPPATPTPAPTPVPSATPQIYPTPTPTPGLGKTTASGVSNSQASGFTTPTKENPLPKTPTSPTLNIDEENKKFKGFGF